MYVKTNLLEYIPCTRRTIHSSTPSFLSAHQMTFLGTQSNAFSRSTKAINRNTIRDIVELQWLEHLWNHENMFKTGVVRTNEVSVNHSTRSGGKIGCFFLFSLTGRYVVCSH